MAAFLVVAFSLAGVAQSLPEGTTPEMIKQMLAQKGYNVTDADMQRLKQQYTSNQAKLGSRQPGKAPDSLAVSDSAKSASAADSLRKIQKPAEIVSVYENIVNNVVLDPDSLLKNLPIFGLDVFANTKQAGFVPPDYLATPADYPVGPGDEIIVSLWGRLNEEYRLTVDREGAINIPHVGPVAVAGLTFADLQKNILDNVQKIEGVQATVSMGELRSIGVYVVGEVKTPGLYTVSSLSNVTNALFAAGGPNRRGSLRSVQVKRNGIPVTTVDFYDFLLSGRDNASFRLKSGDAVVVPIVKSMVAVVGNVRRSAFYEIRENTRLKDAIALAGGVTPAAWTNRIQIQRFKENQIQIVLDLASAAGAPLPDFEVKDGDIIKVFPILEKDKNAVYLSGNVVRQGKYEFKESMRVSDMVPDFNALLPETYFNYAVVIRQDPPNFLDRIIPFNLKNAIDNHTGADNISLQPKDVVFIYARDFFEPNRTVTIGGAVTTPGTFKLLENMRVRDLIIKAGGVLEEASAEQGELYRRNFEGENVTVDKIDFCVHCALENDSQYNLLLKKSDEVYIRTKKGWEEQKHVILKGEFVYPGDYVLLKDESLGDIIVRAGGFSKEAYLPAAIFSRQSVKSLEKQRLDEYITKLETDAIRLSTELAAKGEAGGEAQSLMQQQMLEKLRATEPIGRVVVDLTVPDHYKNLILEDGDSLFVPKTMGTVSVIGEVYNPSTFKYEREHARARDYLSCPAA